MECFIKIIQDWNSDKKKPCCIDLIDLAVKQYKLYIHVDQILQEYLFFFFFFFYKLCFKCCRCFFVIQTHGTFKNKFLSHGLQVSGTTSSIPHVILISHDSDIRTSELLSLPETKTILCCLSFSGGFTSNKPLICVITPVLCRAGLRSVWHPWLQFS